MEEMPVRCLKTSVMVEASTHCLVSNIASWMLRNGGLARESMPE